MAFTYKWAVLGYLAMYLCYCSAALNGTIPKNSIPYKNKTLSYTSPQFEYYPFGPLVNCSFLPFDFIECDEPQDLSKNKTSNGTIGCYTYGGSYRYEDTEKTKVLCEVLPGIECYGPRSFIKEGIPCVKYGNYYFLTTLLYSILLGFLGIDRFCLGQTGTAVVKLLTLGGIGFWWIADIILLITNRLQPEDGSNWNAYV